MAHRQFPVTSGTPFRVGVEVHDQHNYYYPPVHHPQHPPAAHMQYAKRPSERQTTEGTRVQSSLSSASGSSGPSFRKHQTPFPGSQWPSPTLERTLVNSDPQYPAQWQQPGSVRVEHNRSQSEMPEHVSPALAYIRERRQMEDEDDEDEEEEDHALWVLFWLSVLDPFHSLTSCLFTFFVMFGFVLATPIQLVRKQASLGDQLIRTLAPMFKNHIEMMYGSSVDYAFEWDFRPGMLILVQLLCPLLSIGVAVASWVTAAFWVFAHIMGNPDGTERRDDGRDAVLAVRNWWERCLLTALRPRSKQPPMRSVV